MAKKLEKRIEGTKVIVKELASGQEREYDFSQLPPEIQEKLGPFGLSHKIGDAAAGKSGEDAVAAMDKVWEGLMAGNWQVRAPAAPKLSRQALAEAIAGLSPKEQEVARRLLEKINVKI